MLQPGGGTEVLAESLTHFPQMDDYCMGPRDLEALRKAKASVRIPVIASLERHLCWWVDRLRRKACRRWALMRSSEMLHAHPPPTPGCRLMWNSGTLDICEAVQGPVKVPVAMKLSTFLSFLRLHPRPSEGRGRRPGPLQSVLPPNSTSKSAKWNRTWCSPPQTRSASHAVDRDALRQGGFQSLRGWVFHMAKDDLGSSMAGADAWQAALCNSKYGPATSRLHRRVCALMGAGTRSAQQIKGSLSAGRVPDPTAFECQLYEDAAQL